MWISHPGRMIMRSWTPLIAIRHSWVSHLLRVRHSWHHVSGIMHVWRHVRDILHLLGRALCMGIHSTWHSKALRCGNYWFLVNRRNLTWLQRLTRFVGSLEVVEAWVIWPHLSHVTWSLHHILRRWRHPWSRILSRVLRVRIRIASIHTSNCSVGGLKTWGITSWYLSHIGWWSLTADRVIHWDLVLRFRKWFSRSSLVWSGLIFLSRVRTFI